MHRGTSVGKARQAQILPSFPFSQGKISCENAFLQFLPQPPWHSLLLVMDIVTARSVLSSPRAHTSSAATTQNSVPVVYSASLQRQRVIKTAHVEACELEHREWMHLVWYLAYTNWKNMVWVENNDQIWAMHLVGLPDWVHMCKYYMIPEMQAWVLQVRCSFGVQWHSGSEGLPGQVGQVGGMYHSQGVSGTGRNKHLVIKCQLLVKMPATSLPTCPQQWHHMPVTV